MIKPASLKYKWLAPLILVAVAALVISGGCKVNESPVISGMAVSPQGEINPGETVLISCTAVDPDNDVLSYNWSTDGGTISGSGAAVSWTAPDELGSYTVTVQVSDDDNVATNLLTLAVLAPNTTPVIESLTTDCPRVKPAGTATITCEASDPDGDELTYTWSAERGAISGEGAIVTWVGPSEYGDYVITVTVNDGRGGTATYNEIEPYGYIIVCSCGSACD